MLQQFYPQVTHSYRFELNKDMNFAAAHRVPHPDAGACQNMHGHTYFVNITVAGDSLNDLGFLVDFKTLKDLVHKRYDHTVLNSHQEYTDSEDDLGDFYPTTEVVAETIHRTIQVYLDSLAHKPMCLQIVLRETPTSYVIFRPKRLMLVD